MIGSKSNFKSRNTECFLKEILAILLSLNPGSHLLDNK